MNKTTDDNMFLTQYFTLTELNKCIKILRKENLQRKMGFPWNFFWNILALDLLTVLMDLDRLSRLPDSFRVEIVTLLYKDSDKTDLKNWRPITLLNFDCKLFSKILATRMSLVLEELIHLDQACAVPDHDRSRTTFY